ERERMRACRRFLAGIPHSQVGTHVLLTRPPLAPSLATESAFDLHVLGTPPAFILSQDQTRHPTVLSHRRSHACASAWVCERSRPSAFVLLSLVLGLFADSSSS